MRGICLAPWEKPEHISECRGTMRTRTLLSASTSGSRDLYKTLHAYSMLDMNVVGFEVRGVSTTYTRV